MLEYMSKDKTVVRRIVETGLILFIAILAFAAGVLYSASNPQLDNDFRSVWQGEPDFGGSDRVVFSEEDLSEFSEVYRDAETEFAWCLRVEDTGVASVDFPNEIKNATEGSIRYSCDGDYHNGGVHTHPSSLSTAELSEKDENILLNSGWKSVSCVVFDPVELGRDLNPNGIACYSDAGGDVERLEVTVRESS